MSRSKVRLQDNIGRVIFIEKDATVGAQIGVNFLMSDGSLATAAKLNVYLASALASTATNPTNHKLLQGLTAGDDHPQYLRKDTLTTRGDIYVRGATTVQRLARGTANQLLRSDGTDLVWVTLSPVLTLGTDATGNTTFTNLGNATLNVTISNNAVTDAKLRDSAGLSVIGRSASTTGDPADILAASDGHVLRRSGATVGFGTVATAGVADDAITDGKLRNSAALSVIGRSANSTGDPADIAAGTDNFVLRRSGTSLGFGLIPPASTTFATTDRIMGRDTTGAGAGEELTLSAVLDFVGSAAQGDILYRGSATWARLPAGTDLYVLQTRGPGANPQWAVLAASSLVYGDASVPVGNTVANTVTESAFASSYSVAVADLTAGTALRVKAQGVYGTDATPPTLRLKLKLNSTLVADTTAFTTTGSLTNRGWELDAEIMVTDDGVGGEVEAQAKASFSTGATTAAIVHMPNAAPVSVDLSAVTSIVLTAQWGTADADNTITVRQFLVNLERTAVVPPPPVVALLHFNGVDATTLMLDMTGKSWATAGDAQLDTAQFKFGTSSLLLDGTGDHVVSMTDADFIFGTADFTIEGWVRYDTRSGNNFMFSFGGGWAVYTFTNQWALFDGVSSNPILGGTTADDTWYHVALCRSGSTIRLFVDGTSIGSASNTTNFASNPIYLGSSPSGTNRMTGWIDEFRVTTSALYTSNFTPPSAEFDDPDVTSAIVSLLHMEGSNGSTTFTDETGKTWTASGTATISTAQFKFGAASMTDPTANSYIDTPAHADFGYGTGDFTIEFWIRPTTLTGAAQLIYDQRTSGTQVRPTIFTSGGGDLIYYVNGAARITAAASTIAVNNWYHVVVCRYNGSTKMFVNGAQVGSTYTDANSYETPSRVLFGVAGDNPSGGFGFIGYVDEMCITKGHAKYVSAFTQPTQPITNP